MDRKLDEDEDCLAQVTCRKHNSLIGLQYLGFTVYPTPRRRFAWKIGNHIHTMACGSLA